MLEEESHLKPLRCINTLKPFYDAHFGPLKDKFQYQSRFSLLLIVRGVLLIIFAITSTSFPNLNIMFMILTANFLLCVYTVVGLPYKKKYLSILECSFILNLGFVGVVFLFLQSDSRSSSNQTLEVVVLVSISIAILEFVGILIFHLVTKCAILKKKLCVKDQKNDTTNVQETQQAVELRNISPNEYDSSKWRESVLDYTS